MTLDPLRVLRDGWQMWRRDRPLLAPLSGLFHFLPQWAVLLLVPPAPTMPPASGAAAMDAWAPAMSDWLASHGWLYVLAALLTQFGTLAAAVLYLDRPATTLGAALARALRLFPRFLLAALVVAMPLASAMLLVLGVPGGRVLVLLPLVYLLGRTCLVAPVLAAERATGAGAAVVRSWVLTRGHGLPLALLVGGITIVGQLVAATILSLDAALKSAGAANPVVLAMIDAAAAAATWASLLALALAVVAVYRRLAR